MCRPYVGCFLCDQKNSVQRSGKPHFGGEGREGRNSYLKKKKHWIWDIRKEIKDSELLLSFYVCLFVLFVRQIAQYQQGYFGLIADCFGLNLINMSSNQKSRNLQTFIWLSGKYCPTAYKRVGYNLRFLTENVSTNIQRILLICYSYESYANVEMKDHPIEAS